MLKPELARIVADLLAADSRVRESMLREASGGSPETEAAIRAALRRVERVARGLDLPLGGERGGEMPAATPAPLPRHHPWLVAGERIGPFEIVAFHAGGGSSEVYRARRVDGPGEIVALKVLAAWPSASARARFLREAEIARQVEHPSLSRILESGEDAARGLLYHAMAFVPGPTLARVLDDFAAARQRPDARQRRQLAERFREAAAALAVLHRHGPGILHRDVKPGNLVLRGDPDKWDLDAPIVLVDFGLAREQEPEAVPSSTVLVSWPYAAPEVVLGWQATPRSDVFALGVTMHDLFAGQRPGDRPRAHTAGLPPLRDLVPGIDADLAAVVDECCQVEARWRYGDAGALHRDLDAWLSGRTVGVQPRGWLGRAQRSWRRHPTRTLARALVRLLVLLAAVVGISHGLHGWSTCREATRAWDDGDLEVCVALVLEAPAWARALFLAPELCPGAVAPVTPESMVLGEYRASGAVAAQRTAAAWLERDGLGAHPLLVRFLARSMEPTAAPDAVAQAAALAIVGKLLYERPDRSLEDTRASAALRSALRAIVAAEGMGPDAALAAVGALGGCADVDDVDLLLRFADRYSHQDGIVGAEGVRLALVGLDRVCRRAYGTPEGRLLPARMVAGLRQAGRWMHTIENSASDPSVWHAYDGWYLATVCLAQAVSAEVVPLDLVPDREAPLAIRAASGEPGLVAALRAGEDWLPQIDHATPDQDPQRTMEYFYCATQGYLAGLLGEPEVVDAVHAHLPRLVQRFGLDLPWCRALLAQGLERGAAERLGERPGQLVEPASRMGRALETPGPEPIEFRTVAVEESADVVELDFQMRPPHAAGEVHAMASVAAAWRADGLIPAAHSLNLGQAGRSELRVTFRLPPRPRHGLQLDAYVQRTWRDALPFGGRVGFEVRMDGRPAVVIPDVQSMSGEHYVMPVGHYEPGTHTLQIRLAADATASLWIYSLRLR